jgi:hypothetical protein
LPAKRRVIVATSGGITSAECGVIALEEYPRDEIVFLWHDTKAEDPDTYRFLDESLAYLGVEKTERSDGRSVREVELDMGALANNRMAFCSRVLKAEQFDKYLQECRMEEVEEVVKILGFTQPADWRRIQLHTVKAQRDGYSIRFPLVEMGMTKQKCFDNWIARGIRPPRMYRWSDHANCRRCRRGGIAYMLAEAANDPEGYEEECRHEEDPAFQGHTIFKDRSLRQLVQIGLKRTVNRREAIDIGTCECGS